MKKLSILFLILVAATYAYGQRKSGTDGVLEYGGSPIF